MSSTLGRLGELMGDPGRERVEVPWERSVERLGVRLPQDYRELVERYGYLEFGGDIRVSTPVLEPGGPEEETFNGLYYFNKDVGEMLDGWYEWNPELGRPYEPFPKEGCLLAWANNTMCDYFCWDTSVGDPEQWPVVVWRFDTSELIPFDGGMADFLTALLAGEFPDAREMISPSVPQWRSR
ncbi:SMI1/KNR4 family protein [Kitasatospora sp. NPDC096077]|uniref:SMI1/KNR4 family protein n=1 Tax=Kitasatospora sp. NPDC096077 TaxID=3155544 RepID=UPI00332A513B